MSSRTKAAMSGIFLLWIAAILASNLIQCTEDCEVDGKSASVWENVEVELEIIRSLCGEICDVSDKGSPGKYYNVVRKDFECRNLFDERIVNTKSHLASPPKELPAYIKQLFLRHDKVKYVEKYYDDSLGEIHVSTWPHSVVHRMVEDIREYGILPDGSYGREISEIVNNAIGENLDAIRGKHVLVIGSSNPWIETILLHAGADHITTLDYMKIKTHHPKLTTMTPTKTAEKYLNGTLDQFDAMVSFSSIEHSGLGRYGDALNPWGDLITMGWAWCLLKPGGKALVGVPAAPLDILVFNGARVYGPLMFPHLFANWEQVHSDIDLKIWTKKCMYCYQPIHVLRKPTEHDQI